MNHLGPSFWEQQKAAGLLDDGYNLRTGTTIEKILTASKTTAIDRDKKILEAVVSGDRKRDSWGDTVNPKGWDFERWLKNPVVMWAHNYRSLPVARGISIKASGHDVIAKMQFWEGTGPWAEFVDELFEQYAADPPFMRAFSVGFLPKKWEQVWEENEQGGRVFVGFDFLEQEMHEFSSVPIPAYPEALTLALETDRYPALRAMLRGVVACQPTAPGSADRREDVADLQRDVMGLWAHAARLNVRSR